jgi:hypothetical protein
MNIGYFNKNFFKIKKVAYNIDAYLRDFGLTNEDHIKIIKNTAIDILKNKKRILAFLDEKSTDSFKDLSNSDLIIVTLLINAFKVAKKDILEIQSLGNDLNSISKIIKQQEYQTIKKLLKEKKYELILNVLKDLSKIRLDIAIIVKPKRDSERILKIKLLIEMLYSIIIYESQFLVNESLKNRIESFIEEYNKYSEITDVDVILDFKNFNGNRWDKILQSNIYNIGSLIKSIKLENNNQSDSMLKDKNIIIAINTIINLHELLSELKKIKDVDAHRKYFNEKFRKFVIPIAKVYQNNIEWGRAIKIIKKSKWNELYYIIPRKIRKRYKNL